VRSVTARAPPDPARVKTKKNRKPEFTAAPPPAIRWSRSVHKFTIDPRIDK